MSAEAARTAVMSADEFFTWSESWGEGERYELIEGDAVRLQSERVSHSERKANIWLALRQAIQVGGLDCRAFPDGVSVKVNDRTVREPDALVQCGPYDPDKTYAPNPVVVVEVISPSSVRTDVDRKLIDYFSVPSILHYLIVYDDRRVIHHRRDCADGEITTRLLGAGSTIVLTPPGMELTVESLFADP